MICLSSGLTSSVLEFCKEPLLVPLTTLPTSDIEKLALDLDKSIQLFTTIQVRSYGGPEILLFFFPTVQTPVFPTLASDVC